MYEVDLLWVWSEWGASMVIYSMLVTSEKPRESPTSTEAVRPCIYQAGIASLWPLAAVEGAETHYIWMKSTCYEYEVDGVPQS
jgi:hypothetical protein